MLRLQYGKEFRIFTVWKENAWAIPIGILITSVGGGFLAFSYYQLGWVGISIFFLPLVLSAYAFRLYVSQMQAHMDNLENIVAERTDDLKKLMQEKDEFLAVLTHDMKSPLTTIHLYATMIKEYPQILEKKPYVVDTVLHSQETLTNIVNNILDLEKLKDGGQVPLEKEAFEYVSVAEKVIQMVQVQAEKKAIVLRPYGFDKRISVLADRHHMERILTNLLTNAIKYTPPEGTVIITLEIQGKQLQVQVKDSGYGIPIEELPFVFDRFHRVAAHRKLAAGTGLGLAITKALVEMHDGKIEVTSNDGEGSCFAVRLPIVQQLLPGQDGPQKTKNKNHPNKNRQETNKVTTFISY
jgi:signal transduction histidine kinase